EDAGTDAHDCYLLAGERTLFTGRGSQLLRTSNAPGDRYSMKDSDNAKSPRLSVHHPARCNPARASSDSTPERRNLALISVRISAPAANGTVSSNEGTCTR